MKARESDALAEQRWEKLRALQAHYPEFTTFLEDAMSDLGFGTTEIQWDIARYMEHGPQYLMVQAQRGQAKTTIAACYAIWCLIHCPSFRVLILSAAGKQASDISILIVRLIMTMDVLECMRPDKLAGDRTSNEDFDIHHSLKGVDKSSSISCFGIDSNIQGLRADLLIPDDVESGKNSATTVQRAKIAHITKDFVSICSNGRIVWLGTPQTMESIYNSLPARGVEIRIWPGRYPTPKQMEYYGTKLAPLIIRKLIQNPDLGTGGGMLGDQGKPIDPQLMDERALQKKELDQGDAYFQLQHMLNTTLSDALRFPLKPSKLVLLGGVDNVFPMVIVRGMQDHMLRDFSVADHAFKLMTPHEISRETGKLQSLWAYVDPAPGGANGDETAWAIGGFLNGNIILRSWGGMPGGYDEEKLEALARHMAKWKGLDGIKIEKNMGYGAFRAVWTPILRKFLKNCQIDDDQVSGQKEPRIINTLAPIMGRGALIVEPDVIDEDRDTIAGYQASVRQSYSGFFQLAKMSMARGALQHDDRADALEGLCRHYTEAIAQDQKKNLEKLQAKAHAELMRDPLGHQRFQKRKTNGNNMLRHKRR
jgi:hypothetical protein